jgi:hypothetical protein
MSALYVREESFCISAAVFSEKYIFWSNFEKGNVRDCPKVCLKRVWTRSGKSLTYAEISCWFVHYTATRLKQREENVYVIRNYFFLCDGNVPKLRVVNLLWTLDRDIKENIHCFKQIRSIQSGLMSHRSMHIQYAAGLIGKEQSCRGKFVASGSSYTMALFGASLCVLFVLLAMCEYGPYYEFYLRVQSYWWAKILLFCFALRVCVVSVFPRKFCWIFCVLFIICSCSVKQTC